MTNRHGTCGVDEDFSQQISACGECITRGRYGNRDTVINLEGVYPCIGYCMQFQPFVKTTPMCLKKSIAAGIGGDWSSGSIKIPEANTCKAAHFNPLFNMEKVMPDVVEWAVDGRAVIAMNQGKQAQEYKGAGIKPNSIVMFVPRKTTSNLQSKQAAAFQWRQMGDLAQQHSCGHANRTMHVIVKARYAYDAALRLGDTVRLPPAVSMNLMFSNPATAEAPATHWCHSETIEAITDWEGLIEEKIFEVPFPEGASAFTVHLLQAEPKTRRQFRRLDVHSDDENDVPVEIDVEVV
jgi:hypothetical protein